MDYEVTPEAMCREIIKNAGFHEIVNRRMRGFLRKTCLSDDDVRTIADLYEVYGAYPVTEE